MSENVVIQVENLSKCYQLGQFGSGTIVHDFNSWIARILGKEDPYQKVQDNFIQNNNRQKDIYWALSGINFEVKQGEVLGIIGKNGAGKSTLLKIISKVTSPTKGQIKIKGRIASLLEVGTGFHPELTGRENIFLNGAILGMTKSEIKSKFDEIVDFSGVEKFIDTPVKRYSSGMYVRLAFAVAAHLEPEILIIDEVLAVGDAEFQKKCLGKMDDVAKKDGRTVIFVSHNMTAIQNLCKKSILLKNGYLEKYGETQDVIIDYFKDSADVIKKLQHRTDREGNGKLRFINYEIINENSIVKTGQKAIIRLYYKIEKNAKIKNVEFSISINTLAGNHVLVFSTEETRNNIKLINNDGYIDCIINYFPLTSGMYSVNIYSSINGIISDYIINAFRINVDDSEYYIEGASKHPNHPIYIIKHEWNSPPNF
ncbi:MAG: ABC transporter ATP-binding protein [Bacteroidota bacterium]|nr:ABC transporter ATP-binding protein [Bacteroidota bacterium]